MTCEEAKGFGKLVASFIDDDRENNETF